MPWQVPLHCCGHDLILTTSSSTFSSYSHLLSIHITHALSLAENSLGNRSENCRLSLVTKSCLASVKAEHCDVQNMTSVCLAVSLQHRLACGGSVYCREQFLYLCYAS